MIFERFYPKEYTDSAYNIDYEGFFVKGYRGVIFDIDNTLVPHGAPADERSIELMKRLKGIGYQVLFLSNNKEPRVKMFNDAVDCLYIYKAGKPAGDGYLRALRMMGTDTSNTLCVGDQLFTDMWGGNKAGLYTILVDKIDKKEEIQIVIKRRFEWIVMRFYKRYLKKKGVQ